MKQPLRSSRYLSRLKIKLIWRLFPLPELPFNFLFFLLTEIKPRYCAWKHISSAFLLQCKHEATAQVVTRSKASEVHCFPAPLWAHSNKADGANYLHNELGLQDTQVSQGMLLPRPTCSLGLKFQTQTKPQECHMLPNGTYAMTARQPRAEQQHCNFRTREQNELTPYCDTQKSNQFVSSHALTIFSPRTLFCRSNTQLTFH